MAPFADPRFYRADLLEHLLAQSRELPTDQTRRGCMPRRPGDQHRGTHSRRSRQTTLRTRAGALSLRQRLPPGQAVRDGGPDMLENLGAVGPNAGL